MDYNLKNFIVVNSPDGGFLQSVYWRKFQEIYGRKTFHVSVDDDSGEPLAYANIITHILPIVGDYFYIPRGPVTCNTQHVTQEEKIKKFLNDLISLARENNINWIRVEPNSKEELNLIRENLPNEIKIKKSPVDMQPREILVLDITKNENELLAEMKQKTRYNIRLAEKRGVRVSHNIEHITHNINEFLRLVKITAERDKITAHPDEYYRKMFEIIPGDILKLYIAEYEGKIISANMVSFFGKTATYMHGASDYAYRDVMAPYLLQWQAILDARKMGCERYDFGGVKTKKISNFKFQISNSWLGVTRFKTGFAPNIEPIKFPGCYDIILKPGRYNLYRILQKIKKAI